MSNWIKKAAILSNYSNKLQQLIYNYNIIVENEYYFHFDILKHYLNYEILQVNNNKILFNNIFIPAGQYLYCEEQIFKILNIIHSNLKADLKYFWIAINLELYINIHLQTQWNMNQSRTTTNLDNFKSNSNYICRYPWKNNSRDNNYRFNKYPTRSDPRQRNRSCSCSPPRNHYQDNYRKFERNQSPEFDNIYAEKFRDWVKANDKWNQCGPTGYYYLKQSKFVVMEYAAYEQISELFHHKLEEEEWFEKECAKNKELNRQKEFMQGFQEIMKRSNQVQNEKFNQFIEVISSKLSNSNAGSNNTIFNTSNIPNLHSNISNHSIAKPTITTEDKSVIMKELNDQLL